MTLPFPRHNADTRLRSALVERISSGTFFVADAVSLIQANRSASCLLQPEKDDLVLVMEDGMGNASIITVLARKPDKPAIVAVDEGDLVINGAGKVLFKSRQGVNLMTQHLSLKARFGRMTVGEFSFSGKHFTSYGRHLQAVYEHIETKVNKMAQHIKWLYRRIGDEDCQLGRLQYQARNSFSIHAQDSSIAAEKGMRLHGSKIELG